MEELNDNKDIFVLEAYLTWVYKMAYTLATHLAKTLIKNEDYLSE